MGMLFVDRCEGGNREAIAEVLRLRNCQGYRCFGVKMYLANAPVAKAGQYTLHISSDNLQRRTGGSGESKSRYSPDSAWPLFDATGQAPLPGRGKVTTQVRLGLCEIVGAFTSVASGPTHNNGLTATRESGPYIVGMVCLVMESLPDLSQGSA